MITYNKKKYPTRTLTMFSIEAGGECTYAIADETLFDAITKNGESEDYMELMHSPEWKIDQEIYFYVEAGQLELSAEQICKSCLDIEFKFISEEY